MMSHRRYGGSVLTVLALLSATTASAAERVGPEVCGNGIDEDGDGSVDELACRLDASSSPVSDDGVIPYEFGQRLFAAAPAPKEFVSMTGGHDRAFAEDSATYYGALGRWLRAIASVDRESPVPSGPPE